MNDTLSAERLLATKTKLENVTQINAWLNFDEVVKQASEAIGVNEPYESIALTPEELALELSSVKQVLEANEIPDLFFIHKCAIVTALLLTRFYHAIENTETVNQIRDMAVDIIASNKDDIKFTDDPVTNAVALATATNFIIILPYSTELHNRPLHSDVPDYEYYRSTSELLGSSNLDKLAPFMFYLLSESENILAFIANVEEKIYRAIPSIHIPLYFTDHSLRLNLLKRYAISYSYPQNLQLISKRIVEDTESADADSKYIVWLKMVAVICDNPDLNLPEGLESGLNIITHLFPQVVNHPKMKKYSYYLGLFDEFIDRTLTLITDSELSTKAPAQAKQARELKKRFSDEKISDD